MFRVLVFLGFVAYTLAIPSPAGKHQLYVLLFYIFGLIVVCVKIIFFLFFPFDIHAGEPKGFRYFCKGYNIKLKKIIDFEPKSFNTYKQCQISSEKNY
jgi:hypothetical protein